MSQPQRGTPTLTDCDIAFELRECCTLPGGRQIGPAGEPWGARCGLLLIAANRLVYLNDLKAMFREATGYEPAEYTAMKREVQLELNGQMSHEYFCPYCQKTMPESQDVH